MASSTLLSPPLLSDVCRGVHGFAWERRDTVRHGVGKEALRLSAGGYPSRRIRLHVTAVMLGLSPEGPDDTLVALVE